MSHVPGLEQFADKDPSNPVLLCDRHDPDDRSARYAQSVLLPDDGRLEEAHALVEGILARQSAHDVNVPLDFVLQLREIVRPKG